MTWTITESLSLCKRYTPGVKRTTFADHPCSIARTLDVVGEWWTPLILRDVAYGVRRFREIHITPLPDGRPAPKVCLRSGYSVGRGEDDVAG